MESMLIKFAVVMKLRGSARMEARMKFKMILKDQDLEGEVTINGFQRRGLRVAEENGMKTSSTFLCWTRGKR